MDAAVLGDRLPEGTQQPLLGPGKPPFPVPALRELEVLAGLAFCEMLSQYPRSAGGHQRGSAAACDPNHPRQLNFARCRFKWITGFRTPGKVKVPWILRSECCPQFLWGLFVKTTITWERKKNTKKKYKEYVHGTVPGFFWGGDFVSVPFLPHKEWPPKKNTQTKFCRPRSPRTFIYVCFFPLNYSLLDVSGYPSVLQPGLTATGRIPPKAPGRVLERAPGKRDCWGALCPSTLPSTRPHLICDPKAGAQGLEPFRGHPGKRDLLGASEWPTFFSRSAECENTSPRFLGGGFQAETRGRIPRRLRGPKTSGPLSRVPPLAFRPLVCSWPPRLADLGFLSPVAGGRDCNTNWTHQLVEASPVIDSRSSSGPMQKVSQRVHKLPFPHTHSKDCVYQPTDQPSYFTRDGGNNAL